MLSPVEACCGDKELTFNGLPVYYGGDLCDSEELEEYGPL